MAFGRARLRVTWDDRPQPSIDAPVALFFGTLFLTVPPSDVALVPVGVVVPVQLRTSIEASRPATHVILDFIARMNATNVSIMKMGLATPAPRYYICMCI